MCGWLIGPCLFYQTVQKLGENAGKWFCLAYCCGCPMGIPLRSMAREKYNIEVRRRQFRNSELRLG